MSSFVIGMRASTLYSKLVASLVSASALFSNPFAGVIFHEGSCIYMISTTTNKFFKFYCTDIFLCYCSIFIQSHFLQSFSKLVISLRRLELNHVIELGLGFSFSFDNPSREVKTCIRFFYSNVKKNIF